MGVTHTCGILNPSSVFPIKHGIKIKDNRQPNRINDLLNKAQAA